MDSEEWQSRRCCKGDNETISKRQFCKCVPALVLRILTLKPAQLYTNLHTCTRTLGDVLCDNSVMDGTQK